MEQSRAQLATTEEDLRNATIVSPIDGVVLSRDREVGDAVSSILTMGSGATLIMTVGDLREVYVKGKVDESDIGKVYLGQPARITVESYKDQKFAGKVTKISPMGVEKDNVTTFEVRVSISNEAGKLMATMTANAEILLEERKGVLAIPEGAIIYGKDRTIQVEMPDAGNRDRTAPRDGGHRHQQWLADPDHQRPQRRPAGNPAVGGGMLLYLRELFTQVVSALLRNKLRSFLTMAGIAWGVASIVLIVAMGDGFKAGQRDRFRQLGENIVILFPGRTEKQAGGLRAGRRIRLNYDDLRDIQTECFLVRNIVAELQNQARTTSRYNGGTFSVMGVEALYAKIRTIPIDRGRFLAQQDEDGAARVACSATTCARCSSANTRWRRAIRSPSTDCPSASWA